MSDDMSRISIDVTEEEHKRLKALAALKGISLKDYLLKSALDSRDEDEEKALAELEAFLDDRIRRANAGKISRRTVGDIFKQAYREAIGQGKIQRRVFSKKRPELLFTHCEHHYIFYMMRHNRCPLIIAVLHENMNLVARLKKRLR